MFSGCLIAQAIYPPRNRGNSTLTRRLAKNFIGIIASVSQQVLS